MKYDFNNLQSIENDILVVYQGGGYDGCIWECNAFLVKDKKFINLITSGSLGIKHENEINRKLENNTYDIYLLSDIQTFISEYHKKVAYNVVKIINNLNIDYIEFPCFECENLHDINDITFFNSDYHGDKPICHECYSLNTCGYCGSEVHISEHININDDIYGCEYCIDRQVEHEINRLKNHKFIIGDKKSIDIKNKIEGIIKQLENVIV